MLGYTRFNYCPKCGKRSLRSQGEKSCLCASCNFLYYHNPASVAIGIIERDKQIILTTRAYEPHQGQLSLPGGFVDYQETLEDALHREIQEELNLKIMVQTYLLSHWEKYVYRDILYYTTVAYFVVQVEDISQVQASDDVASYQFVQFEEIDISRLVFESDRIALKEYGRTRYPKK